MSGVSIYVSGAMAFLRRDVALFLSYRVRTVSLVLTSLFGLWLFYYIAQLVKVPQFDSPEDYFAFVVVGMVIMGVLTSTLGSGPTSIRQELIAGTFERLLVSPLGAVAGIVSMMVFPVIFGLLNGALTLVFAAVLFGVDFTWSTVPLALPVALLAAASFTPFGLIVAAVVLAIKQASALSSFIVSGITVIAGFYFPVELLPAWIEWASHVQPFTPAVDLLRHLILGSPLNDSAWTEVATLVGFTVAFVPISIAALMMAVRVGRRRGTISEY